MKGRNELNWKFQQIELESEASKRELKSNKGELYLV